MLQFLVTYHGGRMPESDEEAQRSMGEWKAWIEELNTAFVNPGNPVGITKLLTADGVSEERSPYPTMGFSVYQADDMESALSQLDGCPHLKYGGTLEVSEIMEMP